MCDPGRWRAAPALYREGGGGGYNMKFFKKKTLYFPIEPEDAEMYRVSVFQ